MLRRATLVIGLVLIVQQLHAQDWELLKGEGGKGDASVGRKVEDFFTVRSDTELFIKQSHKGSCFAFITNRKWPRPKDFDVSFQFKYQVPEGAKCREAPMFKIAFHAEGKFSRTFYRGYHYTNITSSNRKHGLLMNSKILPIKQSIWYGVRAACKGKVIKGKFWKVEDGEPTRWTIEGIACEDPKPGAVGIGYRAWNAQKDTEIFIKDIKVTEFQGEKFEFLEKETRPERTTNSEIGRKHVGYGYEYYSAPGCTWPSKRNAPAAVSLDWQSVLDKVSVPEGWEKPMVQDGKLVIKVPALPKADEAQVAWFSHEIPVKQIVRFQIHCSEGLTPLLWYQNKGGKKGAEGWVGGKGFLDPFAREDLATVFCTGSNRISAYGTNHPFKGRSDYQFQFRFLNGCALWYGTLDEVCDVLEPNRPAVPWNGRARFGFSGKGKAGRLIITPISGIK